MNLLKKTFSLILALLLSLTLCMPALATEDTDPQDEKKTTVLDEIITSYNNPNGRVLSVASYGNVRLYPENSIEGISSCIKLGIDIVTVSVQKTKDDKFVLLTDETLSRMCVNQADSTPASGKVSEYTLEQLKSEFYLRESNGGTENKTTKHIIPSLEEAIEICKGNIMIMINNGWKYAEELNTLARSLDACEMIIIRNVPTAADADAFISKVGVPVCHISTKYDDTTEGSAKDFVTSSLDTGAKLVELAAEQTYSTIFNGSVLNKFSGSGRAFISTTEQRFCGGRDDLISDWTDLVERGYSVIETDYPKELASYIDEIEAYRSELSSLIMQAQGLNTSKYTKESAKNLNTALEKAEEFSGTGCVSLTQIDKARYDIQEALDDLVIRTGDEKTTLPIWAIILIVLVAIFAILFITIFILRIINKRKNAKKRMAKFKDKFKNEAPEGNNHLTSISGEEISVDGDGFEEPTRADTEKADAILADIENQLDQKPAFPTIGDYFNSTNEDTQADYSATTPASDAPENDISPSSFDILSDTTPDYSDSQDE